MSIKNFNQVITITDGNTSQKEIIHDYYKIDKSIRDIYLLNFIQKYIDNNIPFTITYGYNV